MTMHDDTSNDTIVHFSAIQNFVCSCYLCGWV